MDKNECMSELWPSKKTQRLLVHAHWQLQYFPLRQLYSMRGWPSEWWGRESPAVENKDCKHHLCIPQAITNTQWTKEVQKSTIDKMGCNSSAQKNSKNYRSKAQNGIRDILGGKPKKSWYVDVVLSRFMKHCTVFSRGPGCNKVNNPRRINSLSLLIYKGIKSTVTKSPLLQ